MNFQSWRMPVLLVPVILALPACAIDRGTAAVAVATTAATHADRAFTTSAGVCYFDPSESVLLCRRHEAQPGDNAGSVAVQTDGRRDQERLAELLRYQL